MEGRYNLTSSELVTVLIDIHNGSKFWGGILGRKREEWGVAPTGCEKPNAIGFEDGTQYNLTAMADTLIDELMDYKEAKGSADLPQVFQEFVM